MIEGQTIDYILLTNGAGMVLFNRLPAISEAPRRISAEPHRLRDWDQIESPDEVEHILQEIQTKARFDVYRCAELYELAYPGYDGDLAFYLEQAESGRVLYLGVGAGRIFAPIASRNPRAVGLDSSPEMIELLRQRHPELRADQICLADVTTSELNGEAFDTVIAPYSFLQVLEEADVADVLAKIHKSLKPGGRFVTDVFSPYLIPFRRPGLETSIRTVGRETRVAIYIVYDHLRQNMIENTVIEHEGDERVLEMKLHYFFPQELVRLLERTGFDVTVTGDYLNTPFDPTRNDVIVLEARKQASRHTRPNGKSQLFTQSLR